MYSNDCMTFVDLFRFKEYRDYLRVEFSGTGENRGRRALLSKRLKCQTSFLSQVLTDRSHLSLEHAIQTSEFLNHNASEKRYFMLLVQKSKAGSKTLLNYFDEEISKIHQERESIQERINVKTELNLEDQMKYYSTWHYSALHILAALPTLNSVDGMCTRLKLEPALVKNALQFLEESGFVRKKDGAYQIGPTRIHLPKGAPMLPRHHANWRMKAIESVDEEKAGDLHYSGILGISKKDAKVFKERLLQLLQEFEPILLESKEEVPIVLLMDLFTL